MKKPSTPKKGAIRSLGEPLEEMQVHFKTEEGGSFTINGHKQRLPPNIRVFLDRQYLTAGTKKDSYWDLRFYVRQSAAADTPLIGVVLQYKKGENGTLSLTWKIVSPKPGGEQNTEEFDIPPSTDGLFQHFCDTSSADHADYLRALLYPA